MGAISRLSEKCKKCPHVDYCNDKRLEACAFVKMPGNASIKHTAPVISMSAIPMAMTHTPITINMGNYESINTSMEEINEKIKKQFYKNAFNINCGFNRR